MIKIALTGNIASGKSLVEEYLQNRGFKTLCLDKVTADIYNSDEIFKRKLVEIFNTSSKKDISKIVFEDEKLLERLENLIHPIIFDRMQDFFTQNKSEKFVIVDAPTLFESGFNRYFDKIILVCADKNIRLKRLQERNSYTKNEALIRINAQKDETNKIKMSDYIIENNGSKEALYSSCDKIIKELNTL